MNLHVHVHTNDPTPPLPTLCVKDGRQQKFYTRDLVVVVVIDPSFQCLRLKNQDGVYTNYSLKRKPGSLDRSTLKSN